MRRRNWYAARMIGPPRLVIFDCDGVLVDSERIAVRVDALVLADLGWPLGEAEIVERFVGRPDEYMVAEIEAGPWRASSRRWTGSTRWVCPPA